MIIHSESFCLFDSKTKKAFTDLPIPSLKEPLVNLTDSICIKPKYLHQSRPTIQFFLLSFIIIDVLNSLTMSHDCCIPRLSLSRAFYSIGKQILVFINVSTKFISIP
jgi:hypothetical protein